MLTSHWSFKVEVVYYKTVANRSITRWYLRFATAFIFRFFSFFLETSSI